MLVDAFDFTLPDSAIALRPASPRDAARLLTVDPGAPVPFGDRAVRDLPALLQPGDALVVNDTRVVPARLFGLRRRGDNVARIEVTLHRRDAADRWRAFVRPAKRVADGETLAFEADGATVLSAVASDRDGGEVSLTFDRAGEALDAACARVGQMPLPPYIEHRRAGDAADAADYQTLFAARPGAVAAPTAGLHFTPALVEALAARGVELHRVTLHVGAGTFLPVKSDTVEGHRMHGEIGTVSAETAAALNAVRRRGGRLVAVGTTSLRILESAAGEDGLVRPFAGETSIFITPGYRFRCVDRLMTNFHLPRSTLFMLVSAFCGLDAMRAAYAHAIATGYRFYSYGDASLLTAAADSAAPRPDPLP
ncbi:tRNA preQ1(34) S-adenosylmethionine ribosyltransferase-isomerase QueA [Lichenibacterium dinghuense]|uniref:tRNA preQ1(34) S-adenosylmethionine ribosyltransferase-isomerase QueA n=1 Tax=Lichenibacterium dinghuense TaxID=2895977 RepID=UPI001F00E6EE|nr:tRNA preQ1(34) S-adenosylmethionine ribosyltransferase-isomerase QueA [Lichenibacterium sp. 6Y81]